MIAYDAASNVQTRLVRLADTFGPEGCFSNGTTNSIVVANMCLKIAHLRVDGSIDLN